MSESSGDGRKDGDWIDCMILLRKKKQERRAFDVNDVVVLIRFSSTERGNMFCYNKQTKVYINRETFMFWRESLADINEKLKKEKVFNIS